MKNDQAFDINSFIQKQKESMAKERYCEICGTEFKNKKKYQYDTMYDTVKWVCHDCSIKYWMYDNKMQMKLDWCLWHRTGQCKPKWGCAGCVECDSYLSTKGKSIGAELLENYEEEVESVMNPLKKKWKDVYNKYYKEIVK